MEQILSLMESEVFWNVIVLVTGGGVGWIGKARRLTPIIGTLIRAIDTHENADEDIKKQGVKKHIKAQLEHPAHKKMLKTMVAKELSKRL